MCRQWVLQVGSFTLKGLLLNMIQFKQQYFEWIQIRGVGANDVIASSPDSYVSYLNTVSILIGKDISPDTLSSEEDIDRIGRLIEGQRAPKTINNFKSAMRQYVAMVRAGETRR
jgi:hypothetical protein